ncbi:helix-turn-helix transcriptional regulator [Paenibacillus larvae]|nr:helix-turn-helix transcriptional regulator [Paenibacillus larvae]MDT2287631.1 helix-turn-helix transcriptional regulator [Paenibacillus larvae]
MIDFKNFTKEVEDLEASNRFSKFIPDRLIEAREARGFTLTDLANIVEISHQAISKYEKEKATLNHDTLEKLSDALHVPVTYFYKSYPKKVDGVIYFRSNGNGYSKSKNIHLHKISWIKEHKYLEQYFNFSKIECSAVYNKTRILPNPFEEIDQIAMEVRKLWNLGNGSISNVVLLLEKAGIIVFRPFSFI